MTNKQEAIPTKRKWPNPHTNSSDRRRKLMRNNCHLPPQRSKNEHTQLINTIIKT